MENEPLFSPRTFELLEGIHYFPTAGFYRANREAFRRSVELPLQETLRQSIPFLPPQILDRLETRRGVFSRFLKNDFGHGGAWESYWGGFYPKGSRRIADAHLAVWMNFEQLQISFYIGDYGELPRQRFIRNCSRFYASLIPLLPVEIEGRQVALHPGSEKTPYADKAVSWKEWLADPAEYDFLARVILLPSEVIATPVYDLAQMTARVFTALFPLMLLSTEEQPMGVIEAFQGSL